MENAETIRLQFAYAYEDFHNAMRWRDRFSWVDLLGWIVLLAAGAGTLILFGQRVDETRLGLQADLWGFKSMLPYVAIAGVGYAFWRFGRGGRAAWEKAHPPEVIVVRVSAENITWERAASRTVIEWAAFQTFEEGPKGFLIRGKFHSLLLPRRAMNDEQAESLRRLLQAHISTIRGFEVVKEMTRAK